MIRRSDTSSFHSALFASFIPVDPQTGSDKLERVHCVQGVGDPRDECLFVQRKNEQEEMFVKLPRDDEDCLSVCRLLASVRRSRLTVCECKYCWFNNQTDSFQPFIDLPSECASLCIQVQIMKPGQAQIKRIVPAVIGTSRLRPTQSFNQL